MCGVGSRCSAPSGRELRQADGCLRSIVTCPDGSRSGCRRRGAQHDVLDEDGRDQPGGADPGRGQEQGRGTVDDQEDRVSGRAWRVAAGGTGEDRAEGGDGQGAAQTAGQVTAPEAMLSWVRSTVFWAMVVVICWAQPKPIPTRTMNTLVTKRDVSAVMVARMSVLVITKIVPMTSHIFIQIISVANSGESPRLVTNQVTTTLGDGRRATTYSDSTITPTCGNPTQPDAARQNRHAW
jgi:hypothetical protein